MRSVVALFSEVASAISVSRNGELCASTRRIAHTFWMALNLSDCPTIASDGFFLAGDAFMRRGPSASLIRTGCVSSL